MKHTSVLKLAFALKIMVIVVFICNLFALILVPFFVNQHFYENWMSLDAIVDLFHYDFSDGMAIFFDSAYYQVWQQPQTVMLTLFLCACGCCTAVILWQAKRVLDTILKQTPFCGENAGNLKRAAVCCFLISGFAFIRVVWSLWYFQTISPLLTYNALFIPIFFMGGLLCLVMSALFRQAAELKAENDLTI